MVKLFSCLATLKLISDWFVTSKLLEKLDNALHGNGDTLSYDEDFIEVTFMLLKYIFLPQILIKLNLIMVIVFMKMILIL